ncbi:dnaJsubfamily B member 1 [Artemisia annua]|uniref:DnaJsubfamily B member 1 n=1 Tax=Artemisia annua TaxID=35608 RepID=A0A2U1KSJ1_ARTAN|nr:dnaJsubfamily B member 1 [Artemisia annua]
MRTTEDIFSELFGHTNQSGSMRDMGGLLLSGPFSKNMCNERVYSKFRGAGGSAEGSTSTTSSKAAAIEKTLPFSLEDLYKGATKKLKISRDVADWTG